MRQLFLLSILSLYLFSSCIERDMELKYSNDIEDSRGDNDNDHHHHHHDDDDDDDHHHDDDDDDGDDHHHDDHHHHGDKVSGKWKGDFFAKSSCNSIGEYDMELKFKRYNEGTGEVSGELEIKNKWLAKDYVEFYFNGKIMDNENKLIITTYKIKKQNVRTCNWCEENTFSFTLKVPNILEGKWDSAGCSDNGFNKENSIVLKKH